MKFFAAKRAGWLLALILLTIVCRPWRLEAIDNIRIAYPSTSFTTMPILAATKFGLYQQEGMRPELILMRPNISVTAVVTGQMNSPRLMAPSSARPRRVCR